MNRLVAAVGGALGAFFLALLTWFGIGQKRRGRALEREEQANARADDAEERSEAARRPPLDPDQHDEFIGRL